MRRLTSRLAPVLAQVLVVAALGCREDAESPTAPESDPALATTASNALAFRQVSAGGVYACGVTTDNLAYCWGVDNYGQLGRNEPTWIDSVPGAVSGGFQFRNVSAGWWHTCGVTTDDHAYCWGANDYGQLGDGTTTTRETPLPVAGGLQFRQVDAGGHHACGVTTDDHAYCWGANYRAQLGDLGTTQRPKPVPVAGLRRFRQISAGYEHTCGVTTDDRAFCWGSNRYGQVGDSTEAFWRFRPVLVAGGRRFRQVSAGRYHTCGVTTADRVFCWGNGRHGELGNGKTYLSFWPRLVAGGLSFRRVTAGRNPSWEAGHTCGVTTGNRAYCWGWNGAGQLGDGTTTQRLTPVAVAGGLAFDQVTAGGLHTCGKTAAAMAYCWGYNDDGELGDGTTTQRSTPVRVVGPT